MMSETGIVPILQWLITNPEFFAVFCFGSLGLFTFAVGIRERNRQISLQDMDKRVAKLEKAVDILIQLNRRDRPQQ